MTGLDLAFQQARDEEPQDISFDRAFYDARKQITAMAEVDRLRAKAANLRGGGISVLTEPGGLPHTIASAVDYAVPHIAEAVADPVLSLGSGLLYRWPAWAINKASAVMHWASGSDPKSPYQPTNIETSVPSLRGGLNWLTDDEYGKRVEYARQQFEGPTGELNPMMAARMVAQEAIGLFTSFGGIGLLAKGGGTVSAGLRAVDKVTGLPGRFVHGVGRVFQSPAAMERYSSIVMRVAKKAGMSADDVARAAAAGRLTREVVGKMPGVSRKIGAWLTLRGPEIAGTAAGLGLLEAVSGEADAEEAAGSLVATALLSPMMVGMGSLAGQIQRSMGGGIGARMIAGAMEGTGFAAITMSPKEWWDYGSAVLDGDWDKVGEMSTRVLGQAVGMALLRGFSVQGLPAWRRNSPEDRAKPIAELAANQERVSVLQEMGWVGEPVGGGEVEFRQAGREGTFKLREAEGGGLVMRFAGKELRGDDAVEVLNYLEARTAAESLLPHLYELPESWTETTPGVFRDVAAAKEYALRADVWRERDLTEGANAPWRDSSFDPPSRAIREIDAELKRDLGEIRRLAETAAKELPETLRETKDAMFHVELADHLIGALVRGADGPARTEARAFLRSSLGMPASKALRTTARILAGLSNAKREVERVSPNPPADRGGRRRESAATPLESEALARSTDWSKASRAERRTAAAEYVQLRQQEGGEASEADLRQHFGVKDARTRKKIRRLAGDSPGARYGGERAPAEELEGKPGVKPIRAMDLSRAFRGRPGDPIQTPGREGGMANTGRMKGAAGVYYPFAHMDRARVLRDWATRAHEWSHAMERTMGGLGKLIPAELLPEAAKVARYYGDATGRGLGLAEMGEGTLRAETWAEYWARHILGDEARLAEEAPGFHRWAQEWIAGNPQLKDQVEYLRDAMHRWRFQGAKARAMGQVVTPGEPRSPEQIAVEGTRLQQALRSLDRQLFDAGSELRRVVKLYGLGPDTKISRDPYKLGRLYSMAAVSEAERMLRFGTHDAAGNKTGEAPLELLRAIPEAEQAEFVAFMVAAHEAELLARGKVTSGGKEELGARIRQLKGTKTYDVNGEKLTRTDIARRINDYFGRVLDYTVGHGLFDQATADIIKSTSKYYNPFYRQFGEDAPPANAKGESMGGPAVRRQITGGVRSVLDPREAMIKWTVHTIASAHHYAVRKALVTNLAYRDMGGLAFEVPADQVPDTFPLKKLLEDAAKLKEKLGKEEQAQLAMELAELTPEAETLQYWHQADHPKSSRPWFVFTPRWSAAEIAAADPAAQGYMRAKNGKQLWIEVDPRIYEFVAGSGIGNPGRTAFGASTVGKLMRGASAAVRLGVTGVSPVFTVRNLIRDVLTYPLYATRDEKVSDWMRRLGPLEGMFVFAKSAMELGRNSADAARFKALGGQMPTHIRTEMMASTGQHVNVFGETNTALGKVRGALKAYTEFLSRPEGVLRFAEFKTVFHKRLSEGWSEADAAHDAMLAAKEVTLNFTAGGVAARALNQYVPYINAHLQGQRKFWRTALGFEGKRPALRAWSSGIVNMSFMSTAAWLTMKLLQKEDQWAALDEQQRNRYWFFFVPGMDGPIQIPKPFEFGSLISHPVEKFLDTFGESHPTDTADWAVQFLGNVFGPFLPSRWGENLPAGIKPTIEQIANKDMHTGRAIVPEWMTSSREPGDQAHRWNTAAAKAVGSFLHLSPARIDHFLGEHTGGLWGSVNHWAEDVGSFISGGEHIPVSRLTGGLSQMVPHPYKGSQRVTDFYDRLNELKQRSKTGTGEDRRQLRILDRAAAKIAEVRDQQETMSKATVDAELHRIANEALTRIAK